MIWTGCKGVAREKRGGMDWQSKKRQIRTAVEKISCSLSEIKKQCEDDFKALKPNAKEALNKAINKLDKASENLNKAGRATLESAKEKLMNAASSALVAAEHFKQQVLEEKKALPAKAKAKLNKSIDTLRQSVTELKMAKPTAKEALNKAINEFNQAARDLKKATALALSAAQKIHGCCQRCPFGCRYTQ